MSKVKIEKLVYEGWGIGRDEENRTIFVKKAVSGDIVNIRIIKEKKNYSEGVIDHILEPSPKRIYPECPHFNQCGSCDHQNIAYPDQLKFKNEIFRETLSRAGVSVDSEPIIPGSDESLFYRNSIRFFLVTDKDNQIGFARHGINGYGDFCPIKSCLLQSKRSNEFLTAIKTAINKKIENKSALWQIRIREGKFTGEFMVEVITLAPSLCHPERCNNEAEGYLYPTDKSVSVGMTLKSVFLPTLRQFPEIKSIYYTIAFDTEMKRVKRMLIFGSPVIHEKIGPYTFQISPKSFFQTNSLGVKTLYDKIKSYAGLEMGDRVLDLFCGTGTIGIYLSTLAKEVTGIEIVPEAIRDAKDNARLNKVHNCTFICDDSEHWLEANLSTLQGQRYTIIVDPPRAGLTKRAIKLLSELVSNSHTLRLSYSSTKIVYVSCNPATFARDVKYFESKGIELSRVQPIDIFPQTHHIECVGLLEKKRS